jgi:hypothetical protein
VLQRASLPLVRNKFLGVAALVFSLALLSLSQAVLFVMTVIAIGLAEVWNLARYRHGQAVVVLLGLGLSLLIARWLGGFFVSGPFPPVGAQLGGGLQVRNFAAPGAVLGQIQWDLASFGALLILGSVGLFRVRCDKAFLTMLVALPLVIVNMLRYQYTWDIVKFGTSVSSHWRLGPASRCRTSGARRATGAGKPFARCLSYLCSGKASSTPSAS